MGIRAAAISVFAAGVTLTAPGFAGPADRVLRACAPGIGSAPAATLIDEGWLASGGAHQPHVAAGLGLLEDAPMAANMRIIFDSIGTDFDNRAERGRKRYDKSATESQAAYLTPYDGSSVAQITHRAGSIPQRHVLRLNDDLADTDSVIEGFWSAPV